MLALKVTLPPETRPGVRVDQATARLARAPRLKVKLEEKLFEVETAVQDNLNEVAAAAADLENVKRAHPKRPNHRFWLSLCHLQQRAVCRTPRVFALVSEKHGQQSRRKGKSKTPLHRRTQEEIDTAHKLAKLVGWVGEKLAAPNPPPRARAPGMGHWLYALPQSGEWSLSNGAYNTGLD